MTWTGPTSRSGPLGNSDDDCGLAAPRMRPRTSSRTSRRKRRTTTSRPSRSHPSPRCRLRLHTCASASPSPRPSRQWSPSKPFATLRRGGGGLGEPGGCPGRSGAAEPEAELEPEPEPAAEHAPAGFDIPDGYRTLQGEAHGDKLAVAVVVSRFNGEITNRLLTRALDELDAHGVAKDAVTVAAVPGAFELPLAAMALAKTRRYGCVIALGCVIRGETKHFDFISSEAASGLQLAALETGNPVSLASSRARRGSRPRRASSARTTLFAARSRWRTCSRSSALPPGSSRNVRYRPLGSSGLMVSVVGLGIDNFGRRCDRPRAREVVDAALAAGITLIDTADVYGGGGDSESFIGDAIQGRRDDVVLATKFGADMRGKNGPDWGARGSRRYIRSRQSSLRRLQTEWIDLYQFHFPDPHTPIEETLAALDELVREGKIRYAGSSNRTAWQVVEAEHIARRDGRTRIISAQNHYSLLERGVEAELRCLRPVRDRHPAVLPARARAAER